MTRSYAYYPGCSQHSSSREYEATTRLVCNAVGVELKEIAKWTCCGASSAHVASRLLGHALPARNLALASAMEMPITTGCPACFARLKTTAHDLAASADLRAAVSNVVDRPIPTRIQVVPILGAIEPEEVVGAVRKPLEGLKVACYYGCMFVRPHKITEFDDEENPQSMDRLLAAAGAEVLDWSFKTECCGASMTIMRPEIVVRLTGHILAAAKGIGADCVAVACPMCQANLDQRQDAIGALLGSRIDIPVVYFTQLLGLALGFETKKMMFERHLVNPTSLLQSKGLS